MLLPAEYKRYQKHLNLPEVGVEGQLKLKNASVLVVGAGGLGCPVLLYLTAAGVGTIGVVDPDVVDISNLQRQVLYTTNEVGKPKAKAAVAHLQKLNPEVTFDTYSLAFESDNARAIAEGYDIVVDCTDNFKTRYLINDVCVTLGKPFVYGAIHRFEGQVAVLNHQGGPTYRCLFPEFPNEMEIPNCNDTGVLGVLPGVIGTYQATEVIKMLTGLGEPLSNHLLMVDLLAMSFQKIRVKRRADAETLAQAGLSSGYKPAKSAANGPQKIAPQELANRLAAGEDIFLLDVRERPEFDICHLEGAVLIPVGIIPNNGKRIPTDKPVVVYCHHGIRSANVANYLHTQFGLTNLYNLDGGIHAWAREVEPEMEVY
ncbi:molybdopterin-synthase adenylyltransferase MoeB [Rudanella paleaurantiibacter]|uniref:Molybdopterin-synthase adenylyltransferase n=1 Tax=Rudanella paleaurantiibacter TaxID=2614655 RepID=A0A7J5U145_9BACT|nr:molybdopterin-synthase adenylyltransferase MoeB [Rudanella paleaurantiibacter]KAB7731375.1 molybdopterin-synthase adenylyltransferase MoeB [Rudanella paleaurantiibacter]